MSTEIKVKSRAEKILKADFPRMIVVNIDDLSHGEIHVWQDDRAPVIFYERIADISPRTNEIMTERFHRKTRFMQEPLNPAWTILDVPRVGSTWEMMHGQLRIKRVDGTLPDEIEIHYEDLYYKNPYEPRPPIAFKLWSDLRQAGFLLAVD